MYKKHNIREYSVTFDARIAKIDGMVIDDDGDTSYWVDGKLHRVDGAAIEHLNGDRSYWVNGVLHRTDGPAVEDIDGAVRYCIHGNQLTEEEFKEVTQSDEHLNWYLLSVL